MQREAQVPNVAEVSAPRQLLLGGALETQVRVKRSAMPLPSSERTKVGLDSIPRNAMRP